MTFPRSTKSISDIAELKLFANQNIAKRMTYLYSYFHFRFPAPSMVLVSSFHAMDEEQCLTTVARTRMLSSLPS